MMGSKRFDETSAAFDSHTHHVKDQRHFSARPSVPEEWRHFSMVAVPKLLQPQACTRDVPP